MKKFYVYRYLRSNNTKHGAAGEPYYIGKGSGKRAWSGHHRVKPPKDQSKIEIICDEMTEADALQAEIFLIFLYGRIDKGTGCLANCSDGGEFTPAFRGNSNLKGFKHSPESKEKMRLAKLGRKRGPNPPSWNDRIRAALTGRKLSEEHIQKHADAMRGRKMPPRSPEHCEAIRRAKLGKPRPDKLSGSPSQRKSALTRTGQKRGPYKRRDHHNGERNAG